MALGHFLTSGQTELEKDADLAVFLVDHLDSLRDPASGSWPGERETRRLQNTCHAVEALYELNLGLVSQRLVEPGVKWLIDLPILRDVLRQDQRVIRIFPMRFKTLAALDRFDGDRLWKDWTALCDYADGQSGWLTDVPGEFSRVMNTMVWADTLVYLRHNHAEEKLWAGQIERVLNTLAQALDKWLAEPHATKSSGDLKGVREVSYAFEILARAGRLEPRSPAGGQIATALIDASGTNTRDRLRTTLYFGLQLAIYFPSDDQTGAAVADLIRVLRERYASASHTGQPDYFHAIALRLLRARHGQALRDSILETLWLRNRQAAATEKDGLEQRQREALTALIHRRINVHLGEVTRLSGTRTRAVVYRVHFSLQSEATDREGRPFAILPGALQLIIKQGSIESLSRTIRRYNELPDELRRFFARHSDQVETYGEGWYLTMEDLVGMAPLGEVLDRLDLRWAGRAEHESMNRLAACLSGPLRALHLHRRRPAVASNELGWLYLTPISESVNAACDDDALAELKPYVEFGFTSNGCAYRSLADYLGQLQLHAPRLTPPALGAAHGDCHSRNLMVDAGFAAVKFVDLETLTYTDDWLTDYGLLLEDLALYRYLPRGQRPDALNADEIIVQPGRIDYPRLPRGADSVVYFQHCLLAQARTFADGVQDSDFKPRLWLAIVRNLIQLISRQLPVHSLDPYRRDEILRLCLVAYAEAVRLLHGLVEHLEGAALADIPFAAGSVPGTTRA